MPSKKNTTNNQTDVVAPDLTWRVAYNGTSTAMYAPANAVKFATTLLKGGQTVQIEKWTDGDWKLAETEQNRAMSRVAGFNPKAVAVLTQFDEYTHFMLKNAPKKNGLDGGKVHEWVAQFVSTCKAMNVTRATLDQVISTFYTDQATTDQGTDQDPFLDE